MKTFRAFIRESEAYLNNAGDRFIWNPGDLEYSKDPETDMHESIQDHKDSLGIHNVFDRTIDPIHLINMGNQLHDAGDINPSEKNSLKDYSGGEHSTVNTFHRFGDKLRNIELISHHTNNIDSSIAKHRTKVPATVWRGIKGPVAEEIQSKGIGGIFHDKGYVSTSILPRVAQQFSNNHVVKIHLPEGSKALYLNQGRNSLNMYEHEVLLPRNSKFKYLGSTQHKESEDSPDILTVHHLEHIPESN